MSALPPLSEVQSLLLGPIDASAQQRKRPLVELVR